MDPILQRLTEARIPRYAYSVTLEGLKQPLLRSIIEDKAYVSKGVLKSISIFRPDHTPSATFHAICARFAAELCLVGASVLCAGVGTIERELRRYSTGATSSDALANVLSHSGFLFVGNLDAIESTPLWVHDWLLEFVSDGGGLIVARDFVDGHSIDSPAPTSPMLDAFLDSTLRVKAATNRTVLRTASRV